MATVTGLTAARMRLIEAASVVSGIVTNDRLILSKFDGSTIDAGHVRGLKGDTGLQGGPGSVAATADNWLIRDAAGRAKAATPVAVEDLTTKAYTDNFVNPVILDLDKDVWRNQTQPAMTGGGLKKVTKVGGVYEISWNNSFLTMGTSKHPDLSPSGYFAITQPPSATAIPILGSTEVVTVGSTIPLNAYDALYYVPPLAATSPSSLPANFRVVRYTTTAPWKVPLHWILVAATNAIRDTVRWGDGTIMHPSLPITLANGWVFFGEPFSSPQYRIGADGKITLNGVIRAGTTAVIGTLPAGYRPEKHLAFACMGANAGMRAYRIDVLGVTETNAGQLFIEPGPPLPSEYLFLDGISFFPGG